MASFIHYEIFSPQAAISCPSQGQFSDSAAKAARSRLPVHFFSGKSYYVTKTKGGNPVPKNKKCAYGPGDQVLGAAAQPVASVCQQFAGILGGDIVEQSDDSCSVSRPRPELQPTIRRRPFPVGGLFFFSALDPQGIALNRGEMPLLQREVNPFIDALRCAGILVSAVHTHWLFDRPRIMYVQFEVVSNPLAFAQAVAGAFAVFVGRPKYAISE